MHRVSLCCVLFLLLMSGSISAQIQTAAQFQKAAQGKSKEIVSQVVKANSEFSFDLHRQLARENKDQNLFFSPYSISNLIAMIREGAREKTAEEITKALRLEGIDKPDVNISVGYRELNKQFNRPKQLYQLRTLNAQWVEQSYPLDNNYRNIVAKQYGAFLFPADFVRNSGKMRIEINDWVQLKTNNLIKEFLQRGDLDHNTRTVLLNATYFEAKWQDPFKVRHTKVEDFTLADGSKVKTSLMNRKMKRYRYVHLTKQGKVIPSKANLGNGGGFFSLSDPESKDGTSPPEQNDEKGGFQIVELPYLTRPGDKPGYDLSMVVILPNEHDGLPELEKNITGKKLNHWIEQMKGQAIDLAIPKFGFDTSYNLFPSMNSLGMKEAFTKDADFSGMFRQLGHESIRIQFVRHNAMIDVDEQGTVAVAVTGGGGFGGGFGPPRIPEFRADHPFLFLIRECNTGNLLFLGRFVKP